MLSNGKSDDKTFINLKLSSTVWPTDEAPKFVKLDEAFKETGDTYSQLEGKLIKIKGTYTPAKGKMGDIYWFKAFIEDGEEICVIESTITNASKDLLNSLLLNVWEVISISLYLNKHKYPSSAVKWEDWKWVDTYMVYNEIDNVKLYNKAKELEEGNKPEEEELTVEQVPF